MKTKTITFFYFIELIQLPLKYSLFIIIFFFKFLLQTYFFIIQNKIKRKNTRYWKCYTIVFYFFIK